MTEIKGFEFESRIIAYDENGNPFTFIGVGAIPVSVEEMNDLNISTIQQGTMFTQFVSTLLQGKSRLLQRDPSTVIQPIGAEVKKPQLVQLMGLIDAGRRRS